MRILLVYPLPPLSPDVAVPPPENWMPLGLSFVAAALRQAGHEVAIFDRFALAARGERDPERLDSRMLSHLEVFRPDLVGFNTVSPLIYDTAACAALIRPRFSGLMVAGGHHATAMPDWTLRRIPELDFVVQGEGEEALVGLADSGDPLSIPGVYRREAKDIAGKAPVRITDLDVLPFPALDLLDMAFYTRPVRTVGRGRLLSCVSLITSRGCPRRCVFCSESLTFGGGVRFHSPAYVLDWLEDVRRRYAVDGVYYHDSDFLADEGRAAEICKRKIARGLHRRMRFIVQTRADRLHRGILGLLKKAGCILVEIGVESFDQGILDVLGKGMTVEQNLRAIRLCQEAGISPHVNLITGLPGETVGDLECRLSRLRAIRGDFTCTLHPLTIDPGSLLYRERGGQFFERNPWDQESVKVFFDRDHLSAIGEAERREWMNGRFNPWQRRQMRLAVLRRNPPGTVLGIVVGSIARAVRAGRASVFAREAALTLFPPPGPG